MVWNITLVYFPFILGMMFSNLTDYIFQGGGGNNQIDCKLLVCSFEIWNLLTNWMFHELPGWSGELPQVFRRNQWARRPFLLPSRELGHLEICFIDFGWWCNLEDQVKRNCHPNLLINETFHRIWNFHQQTQKGTWVSQRSILHRNNNHFSYTSNYHRSMKAML